MQVYTAHKEDYKRDGCKCYAISGKDRYKAVSAATEQHRSAQLIKVFSTDIFCQDVYGKNTYKYFEGISRKVSKQGREEYEHQIIQGELGAEQIAGNTVKYRQVNVVGKPKTVILKSGKVRDEKIQIVVNLNIRIAAEDQKYQRLDQNKYAYKVYIPVFL